ncbi:hypothetical protein [Parabacteroides sp. FAFU027]|nr:hypothetical protein [Parabacteroides sp. FAFU027]
MVDLYVRFQTDVVVFIAIIFDFIPVNEFTGYNIGRAYGTSLYRKAP